MKNRSTLEFWMDDIDLTEEDLEEAKKKKKNKKPYDSMKITTGDIDYNMKMFNKLVGTDGYMNGTIKPASFDAAGHLVGDSTAGGESSGGETAGGGMGESLAEGTYVSRHGGEYEFPDQIKLLDQKQVEKFVLDLDINEPFRVGYITPIELYTELRPYFRLFKATEITGYTGIDYRDAKLDQNTNAAGLERAQQQIKNQDSLEKDEQGNLYGKQMSTKDDFSTHYRAGGANKLGINHIKPNQVTLTDESGNEQRIDLNRILFYIDPNKANIKNKYFVKLLDKNTDTWTDWIDSDRNELENTLFKKIVDHAAQKQWDPTGKNIKFLQKLNMTPEEFTAKYPGLSVDDWIYCNARGLDPMEWLKEHPFSRRWGLTELKAKIHKQLFAEDEQTTDKAVLGAQTGLDRTGTILNDAKPDVRALYTNQIYYISGRPGTFGKTLMENLLIKNKNILTEAKRYVRRYYIRPQEIFCSNKTDIIKALIDIGDENCSVYTLINLGDEKDVTKLTNNDIIYYYDNGILYDKNMVKILDYDLYIKHEEERAKINPEQVSDKTFKNIYSDRMTQVTELEEDALSRCIDRQFIVYCHTNNLNGKKYIGITSQKEGNRWRSGLGYKNQPVFYKAIQKYGWENFSHEIIATALTLDQAKLLEQELIAKYHTYVNDPQSNGYNASLGGEANLKYLTAEEKHQAQLAHGRKSYQNNKDKRLAAAKQDYLDRPEFYAKKNHNNYINHREPRLANDKQYQSILKKELDLLRELNILFPDRLSTEDQTRMLNFRNCRNKLYLDSLLSKFSTDEISSITNNNVYDDRITDITNPDEVNEQLGIRNEFNLVFENVNEYGELLTENNKEYHTCCICGEDFEGHGNNPNPIKENGVCCDSCNIHFVIPARIEAEHEEKNEELKK